jgi:hypothetical protein
VAECPYSGHMGGWGEAITAEAARLPFSRCLQLRPDNSSESLKIAGLAAKANVWEPDGLTTAEAESRLPMADYHAFASGKTASILYFLTGQANRASSGFSASARAVTRELKRSVRSVRIAPSAMPEAVPGFLVDVLAAANRHLLKVDDDQPSSLSDRLRRTVNSSLWSAAQTRARKPTANSLELASSLARLAAKASSRSGWGLSPPPTQPPGQIVRTHPLVPRGPGADLCSAFSWPFGGVLSVV